MEKDEVKDSVMDNENPTPKGDTSKKRSPKKRLPVGDAVLNGKLPLASAEAPQTQPAPPAENVGKMVLLNVEPDEVISESVRASRQEIELPNVFNEVFEISVRRFSDLTRKVERVNDMIKTFDINAEYLEFPEVGMKVRCCFAGFIVTNIKDEKTEKYKSVPCVLLIKKDEDGQVRTYKNGGVQLVRTLVESKLPLDTMVEIELVRREAVANGDMNVFAVTPLISPGGEGDQPDRAGAEAGQKAA